MAEPDTPTGPTPTVARRTAILAKAADNPLIVLMLLGQLGVGGLSLSSLFGRADEKELREQWEQAQAEESADAEARQAASTCARDAKDTRDEVAKLALAVGGLSKRVDDVFAFQGEIHEGMRAAFKVFSVALKVTPPESTRAAEELRAKALLRYQRTLSEQDQ